MLGPVPVREWRQARCGQKKPPPLLVASARTQPPKSPKRRPLLPPHHPISFISPALSLSRPLYICNSASSPLKDCEILSPLLGRTRDAAAAPP